MSQQLSTRAAATIYGRIRALLPDGTPTPQALQQLSDEALRGAGLSRQKLGYMRDLSLKVLDGTINSAGLQDMSDDAIVAEPTKIKGIGRWTVEMLLIFRLTARRRVSGRRSWYRESGPEGLQPPEDARRQTIAGDRPAMAAVSVVASWYLWASLENKK